MTKRDLSDYRSDIRTIMDLDATDLPDATLDIFIRDGMRNAQRFNQGIWSFYEESWTFNTSAATADYTLATAEAGHASSYTIGEIRIIRRDDVNLVPWSRDTYERAVRQGATSTGKPNYWSLWNETLTFYPIPDGTHALTVRGWRDPTDWVDDGSDDTVLSDMPEDFDDAIFKWALGQAYAHQDEPQTSLFYLNSADLTLTQLEDKYDMGQPVEIVMNRGSSHHRMGPRPVEEAPFWWESLN